MNECEVLSHRVVMMAYHSCFSFLLIKSNHSRVKSEGFFALGSTLSGVHREKFVHVEPVDISHGIHRSLDKRQWMNSVNVGGSPLFDL